MILSQLYRALVRLLGRLRVSYHSQLLRWLSTTTHVVQGARRKTTQAAADVDGDFLTRWDLGRRWKVSVSTIKRREEQGILRPVRLDGRIIRYRRSDIRQIEEEGWNWPAEE
jgi:hypothetical protein